MNQISISVYEIVGFASGLWPFVLSRPNYRPLRLGELSQIMFSLGGSFPSFAVQAEVSSLPGEGMDDDGDDREAHSL